MNVFICTPEVLIKYSKYSKNCFLAFSSSLSNPQYFRFFKKRMLSSSSKILNTHPYIDFVKEVNYYDYIQNALDLKIDYVVIPNSHNRESNLLILKNFVTFLRGIFPKGTNLTFLFSPNITTDLNSFQLEIKEFLEIAKDTPFNFGLYLSCHLTIHSLDKRYSEILTFIQSFNILKNMYIHLEYNSYDYSKLQESYFKIINSIHVDTVVWQGLHGTRVNENGFYPKEKFIQKPMEYKMIGTCSKTVWSYSRPYSLIDRESDIMHNIIMLLKYI